MSSLPSRRPALPVYTLVSASPAVAPRPETATPPPAPVRPPRLAWSAPAPPAPPAAPGLLRLTALRPDTVAVDGTKGRVWQVPVAPLRPPPDHEPIPPPPSVPVTPAPRRRLPVIVATLGGALCVFLLAFGGLVLGWSPQAHRGPQATPTPVPPALAALAGGNVGAPVVPGPSAVPIRGAAGDTPASAFAPAPPVAADAPAVRGHASTLIKLNDTLETVAARLGVPVAVVVAALGEHQELWAGRQVEVPLYDADLPPTVAPAVVADAPAPNQGAPPPDPPTPEPVAPTVPAVALVSPTPGPVVWSGGGTMPSGGSGGGGGSSGAFGGDGGGGLAEAAGPPVHIAAAAATAPPATPTPPWSGPVDPLPPGGGSSGGF